MRHFALATIVGLGLAAVPASAQTAVDPENVKAEDVAMSPLSDLNVRKKDIPVVLEMAMIKPYDLTGIKSCKGLTTAIIDLNGALGDDIDVATGEKSDMEKAGNGAGAIAKSVIGSFIPFRGIIREVSGANAQERLWDRALYAGTARRAFLKGMGEQRGAPGPLVRRLPRFWRASLRSASRSVLRRLNRRRPKSPRRRRASRSR